MVDPRIFEQFREIGRDLYTANMISSHGGNPASAWATG
jgi:hypothetical protein